MNFFNACVVFGFLAKEVVLGSLGTLYGTGADEGILSSALVSDPVFTPAVALGLMVFTLLYVPCIGTIAVIKKNPVHGNGCFLPQVIRQPWRG